MNETPPPPPARAPLPQAWWDLSLRARRSVAAAVVVTLVVVFGVLFLGAVGGAGETEAEAFVSALPEQRVALWDELAQCESEGQWDLDTGNGHFGGLQFTLESWDGVGGVGSPSLAPREEQIMRAEMLHDLQGWEAWPRCSVQLGLG